MVVVALLLLLLIMVDQVVKVQMGLYMPVQQVVLDLVVLVAEPVLEVVQ
jgi:hypothetical protein